jgi:hypothetical protein
MRNKRGCTFPCGIQTRTLQTFQDKKDLCAAEFSLRSSEDYVPPEVVLWLIPGSSSCC